MPSILVIVRDAGPGLADTLCSLDGLRRAGWDDVVVAVPSEQAACAAIVTDFGARVVIGGPPDGEAVLRNRAAAACASERILLLEAGERWLDSGDTLAVLEALETGAVGIMRHTLSPPGPETKGEPATVIEMEVVIRGYDRRRSSWVGRGVPDLACPASVTVAQGLIERTGFGPSERLAREMRALGERLVASPHDLDAAYHLCRIAILLSEPVAALRWGEWFCSQAAPDDARGGVVHAWLVGAASDLQRVAEAGDLLARGLSRYPTCADLHLHLVSTAAAWSDGSEPVPGVPSRARGWAARHRETLAELRSAAVPAAVARPTTRALAGDYRLMARTGSWIDTLDGSEWCVPWENEVVRCWHSLPRMWDFGGLVRAHASAEGGDTPRPAYRAEMAFGRMRLATLELALSEGFESPPCCSARLEFGAGDRNQLWLPTQIETRGNATFVAHAWEAQETVVLALFRAEDFAAVDALGQAALDDFDRYADLDTVLRRTIARACRPPTLAPPAIEPHALELNLAIVSRVLDGDMAGQERVGAMRTFDGFSSLEARGVDGTVWSGWPSLRADLDGHHLRRHDSGEHRHV